MKSEKTIRLVGETDGKISVYRNNDKVPYIICNSAFDLAYELALHDLLGYEIFNYVIFNEEIYNGVKEVIR